MSAQLSSAPRTVRGTQDVFKNDEKRYVSRNSPWRFQNTSLMRVIILWFVVILVFTPFYVMLSIYKNQVSSKLSTVAFFVVGVGQSVGRGLVLLM